MITDLKTTIGYKCANCNRNVYKDINIFDIQPQKPFPLTCVCGAHLGEVRYRARQNYVIHATCCFCAEPHSFYIKRRNFWNSKLLSYPCPTAMLTYVAIGQKEAVHEEMKRADREFEEILSNMQNLTSDTTSDTAMFHVLEKIQTLDKAGKLSCCCGNHDLLIDMQEDDIIILCGQCGRHTTIDSTDPKAVENFLSQEEWILH